MTRRDQQWLEDIEAACLAIRSHITRGGLDDGLVFDAVRVRLIEIGEAVKAIDPQLLDSQTTVPWRQVARMRDHLAHRDFATEPDAVQAVLDHDIEPLLTAARQLSQRLASAATTGVPDDEG
jgi:uncharacterized protein with HEPN domain